MHTKLFKRLIIMIIRDIRILNYDLWPMQIGILHIM